MSEPSSKSTQFGTHPPADAAPETSSEKSSESLVSTIGYVLAVSYPVLALSTGVRALYQLLVRTDIVYYFPPLMSAVAAVCYLLATVGFAYRRRWSWWLSVAVLGIETLLTLAVGTWSYVDPELVGRTVWRHFGEDYGYFPFFQPLLGLIWLFWPETIRQYGFAQWSTERFFSRITGARIPSERDGEAHAQKDAQR